MPYIDFCFMLIIIFVGMLSIAYFEPLGKTDIETKKTEVINNLGGKYDVKPGGIKEIKTGLGEEAKADEPRPLVGKEGGKIKYLVPPGIGPKPVRATNAAQVNRGAGAGVKPKSYISPEELEKLKKKLKEKETEIEKLKATQQEGTGGAQPPSAGRGDNYYIDLRKK